MKPNNSRNYTLVYSLLLNISMRAQFLLLFFIAYTCSCFGQINTIGGPIPAHTNNSLNTASHNVVLAMEADKSPDEIAESFYQLSLELSQTGDYVRAESYLNKAITESAKGKGKRQHVYYRELARIQELQQQYSSSVINYNKAAKLCADSTLARINRNDAARVQLLDPAQQLVYLQANASLLEKSNLPSEQNNNLQLQVLTNAAMNNTSGAIELQRNIVKITPDSLPEQKALQYVQLAELYLKEEKVDSSIAQWESAYQLAVRAGNIELLQKATLRLQTLYRETGQQDKELELLHSFLNNTLQVLERDSSFINRTVFQQTEKRITELERDRAAKDEKISQQDSYNTQLLIAIGSLLVLSGGIVIALLVIRKKNKKIELQALRREMSPHFVFNSLNSINQFIAGQDERAANRYLTSYSELMRQFMDNAGKDFIPLSDEVSLLRKYLNLEQQRFPDKFTFQLDVAPEIEQGEFDIPNILIQPHAENAIWHGLRYKEQSGELHIRITKLNEYLIATIEDNGIGITASQQNKTEHQKRHRSMGMQNVRERIRLLNALYGRNITLQLEEPQRGGVKVTLQWKIKK